MKALMAAASVALFCAAALAQDQPADDASPSYRITVNFEENSLEPAPLSAERQFRDAARGGYYIL